MGRIERLWESARYGHIDEKLTNVLRRLKVISKTDHLLYQQDVNATLLNLRNEQWKKQSAKRDRERNKTSYGHAPRSIKPTKSR
jgi:hypothetical protein